MTDKQITFSQLEAVLTDLGFRKKIVPDTGVAYEFPATERLLVVRLHQPDETVPWHVLASARHHLEWWGVIAPTEFDRRLQAAAA